MSMPFHRWFPVILVLSVSVASWLGAQSCLPDGCFEFKVVSLPPAQAKVGDWIDIEFNSTCPAGKSPAFFFDWGDGQNTPADLSGNYYTRSHQYSSAGTYHWRVRVVPGCEYSGAIQVCPGACLPPDAINSPATQGGPTANPNVAFEGGIGPARCQPKGLPNFWVNMASLNLVVEDTLARYQGLGPGVSLTLTFNDNFGVAGLFGKGWSFQYESRIEHSCQGAVVHQGSGRQLRYSAELCPGGGTPQFPVVLIPPFGNRDRLVRHGTYWLWEEKSTRLTWRYDLLPNSTTSLLTEVADSCGNTLRVNYQDRRLKSVTDASGRSFGIDHDSVGRASRLTTPDGRTAAFFYDSSGRMNRCTDFAGTTTQYRYTGTNLTRITVGDKVTNFGYAADPGGYQRLASITDARGGIANYTVNAVSGELTVADPKGGVVRYLRTPQGFTRSRTDPVGGTRVFEYDAAGNLIRVTDELGRITRLEYDVRGNLTRHIDPMGNTTGFEYSSHDLLSRLTNPLGGRWSIAYDSCLHPTEFTSPAGGRTQVAYDAKGQVVRITNPKGKITSFAYDGFGNLESIQNPLGHQTRFSYDPSGLMLTAVQDARGNSTGFTYDANERLKSVLHPDGTSLRYDYDCCASSRLTDELGNAYTFVRDPLLNITSVANPLSQTEKLSYDGNQNLTVFTNALNQSSEMSYDPGNRLVERTDPIGGVVEFAHDGKGNLVSVSDELGQETEFVYDARDLLISTTDALDNVTSLSTDGLGRVTGVTNARGGRVSILFDPDGRVAEKRIGTTTVATFGYDANGNLVTLNDPVGITSASYDDADRVVDIRYPQGGALSMTYDPAGNPLTVRYPGGPIVTYTHDDRDRLTRLAWPGGSIEYEYDAADNLTKETRSNGTITSYTYDAAGRLLSISHRSASGVFLGLAYERDALGRTVREERSLSGMPALAAGRLLASYNRANQLDLLNNRVHEYDEDGNLVRIAGPDGFSASYDHENRLTSLTRNGVTTIHAYNGLGQRVRSSTGSQVRIAHWDLSGRLMTETDGVGKVLNHYIYSGGRLAAMGTDAAGYYFFHFDQVGNTLALTARSGAVAASYRYLPYGAVADRTGDLRNPFTFVGALGVMDDGDGLFFMRNRYYDANIGRFIQKDPIGALGGLNLYSYVTGNPIEKVDPLGLAEEMVLEAFFGKLSPSGMAWLRGFEAQIIKAGADEGGTVLGNIGVKLINPHLVRGGSSRRATDPAVRSIVKRLLGQGATEAGKSGVMSALSRGLLVLNVLQITGLALEVGGDLLIENQIGGKYSENIYAVGATINRLLYSPIEFVKTGIGPLNHPSFPECDGIYRRPLGGTGKFY